MFSLQRGTSIVGSGAPKHKSNKSLKIGLSLMVVVLVILFGVAVWFCWKRRQTKSVGLPFKMQLDEEEEMDDVNY